MRHRPALAVLAVLTLLLCAFSCSAATVFVKWDSPGPTFDGASWTTAFHTVQEGLNSAITGDEIWVAKGTYTECITLKEGVALYAGLAGTETTRERRDPLRYAAILNGSGSQVPVVTVPSGATRATRLDGFIIRYGSAASRGSGIFCSASSSPTITRNSIQNNEGGGIHCDTNSTPLIIDNRVEQNNSWYDGAGISCSSASPVIARNIISYNTIKNLRVGGGICCTGASSPVITGNTIDGNRAGTAGGSLYLANCSPVITNNKLNGNVGLSGDSYDDGVVCVNAAATITNNTIRDYAGLYCSNIPPTVSNNIVAGIRCAAGCVPVLRNNCVYKGIYTGIAPGTGDITADPQLDVSNHLNATSPCINAGWNYAPGLPEIDMDGEGRVFGANVDIGADEYWTTCSSLSAVRLLGDGAETSLPLFTVSAVFDGFFYLQRYDHSAGIRVDEPSHGLTVGTYAKVSGTLRTNADGERYIDAEGITVNGRGSIHPVLLPNRSIGGGDRAYNPETGAGQKGQKEYTRINTGGSWQTVLTDLVSLNNIGLVVSTAGKVTHVGTESFYIDDGSHLDDGSGHIGVKVSTEGQPMPALDSYVRVTGVSSCFKSGADLFRLIRAVGLRPTP